ncbi:MAG: HlyD family efflux transporter periplasmic adaptor subunit [Firmicutes bacterium]|nr:HlyD family efflux transporter periplasmic adaptor subunit [Bacillota bacterium]
MESKRIIQIILVAVFVILIGIGVVMFFRHNNQVKESSDKISTSGRIEGDEYNASSKIAGKVEKIYVEEGQDVKKGQLVARIQSPQLEAQLESARKEVNIWRNRLYQAELALSQARQQVDANIRQAEANLNVYSSQLDKAHASYRQNMVQFEQSKIQIKQSEIEHEQALANLRKSKASLELAELEYKRYGNLAREDAVPRAKYDEVASQYKTAKADYNLALSDVQKSLVNIENSKKNLSMMYAVTQTGQAGIREGEAYVESGRAGLNSTKTGIFDVHQKEEEVKNTKAMLDKSVAMLNSATADLEDTKICAPVDGTITGKIVEPGEVIATGTPIVTLVNMDTLYLRVFLPTDKYNKLKIGNFAEIIPDGMPDTKIAGYVYKISSRAQFTPKNVETKEQRAKLVFEIKIKIKNNRERTLKPGMPAETVIDITKQGK